jgi:hypothetical protein
VGCPTLAPTSESTTPASTSSSTAATLEVCEDLPHPAFGSVAVEGDEAQYSCDEGYDLVGDAARQCLSDLRWSGSAPSCVLACKCKS